MLPSPLCGEVGRELKHYKIQCLWHLRFWRASPPLPGRSGVSQCHPNAQIVSRCLQDTVFGSGAVGVWLCVSVVGLVVWCVGCVCVRLVGCVWLCEVVCGCGVLCNMCSVGLCRQCMVSFRPGAPQPLRCGVTLCIVRVCVCACGRLVVRATVCVCLVVCFVGWCVYVR